MYLPYRAGVHECWGIELYIVNIFHSRPSKETTTAATPEHQTWNFDYQPCVLIDSYS